MRPPPQGPRLERAALDGRLLEAIARGDAGAARRFFDAHVDELHGFLRMVVRGAVEPLLSRTFAAVAERAGEFDPHAGQTASQWLKVLAVDELAATAPASSPRVPSVPRLPRRADPAMLAWVSDATLAVLIRTLQPPRRQALVLSVHGGCDAATVARVVGCEPGHVPGLVRAALADVASLLAEHERRESISAALTAKVAYHLRPLPGPLSDGIVVVRGTQAYVQRAPNAALVQLAFRALVRVIEFLTRRHQSEHNEDDEVGGPERKPKAPGPTPTNQPFRKPEPTPSMREYEAPRATPGTAAYRTPKVTPSTKRLSNPRRPLPSGNRTYGSASRW